jgi:probable F420-dependent oxidoreductase
VTKYGVVFPQTEIGADPLAVRDYAQAAEALGYSYLMAYDHVLGAAARTYDMQSLPGPYREHEMFHEPFVLFGYLAGITRAIELTTGVLILPQRQTVLVAKQAAEVSLLSAGRFRLGVGTGWNWVEYAALGVPFADRGAREEEQIQLLRELWSKPLVTFRGRFHEVIDAGLNPLPRDPIPIWLGGMAEPVLRRVGLLADGWFAMNAYKRIDEFQDIVGRVHSHARAAGRDPASIQIDVRVAYDAERPDRSMSLAAGLINAGATHISLMTHECGLLELDAHISALRTFKALI